MGGLWPRSQRFWRQEDMFFLGLTSTCNHDIESLIFIILLFNIINILYSSLKATHLNIFDCVLLAEKLDLVLFIIPICLWHKLLFNQISFKWTKS